MQIRSEAPQDFDRIHSLVRRAFETAEVSDGTEQDFILQLRASSDYIPELALVAEADDELLGHLMLTRMCIATHGGPVDTLLLACVAVALEHRNQGIATSLIQEGLHRAKALGFTSVVLAGDPAFYQRFGFRPSAEFGITNTNGIPEENVLACELVSGALSGTSGTISFAFDNPLESQNSGDPSSVSARGALHG